MNGFGERLKKRREALGFSQGQVAQLENISQAYLSNLENGRNAPAVWKLLFRLAKRYRTTADYLLGLTDDPTLITIGSIKLEDLRVSYEARSVGEARFIQDLLSLIKDTTLQDQRLLHDFAQRLAQSDSPR